MFCSQGFLQVLQFGQFLSPKNARLKGNGSPFVCFERRGAASALVFHCKVGIDLETSRSKKLCRDESKDIGKCWRTGSPLELLSQSLVDSEPWSRLSFLWI